MELTTIWFGLIAFLWVGYLVLEGFDFGVGILLPVIGRNERERRAVIATIGPVWDGNEVWVLVAGGATFAAFPEWYATLFSGFYLPLFLILVALILRGVAFEYRGKRPEATWRARWDAAIFVGSLAAGDPVGRRLRQHRRRACRSTRSTSSPATCSRCSTRSRLLGGAHDAGPVRDPRRGLPRAQDDGELRARANRVGRRSPASSRPSWRSSSWPGRSSSAVTPARSSCPCLAAVALVGALVANRLGREGWAFIGTAVTIALAVVALFARALPGRHALEHGRRLQPDDDQRVVDRVHAPDHDRGRGDLHPARPALPGLDLLGLPAPRARSSSSRRTRRRAASSSRRRPTHDSSLVTPLDRRLLGLARAALAVPRPQRPARAGHGRAWRSPRPRCSPTPSARPSSEARASTP